MTSEEKIRLLAQKLTLLSNNIDKQKIEIDLIKAQINELIASISNQEVKKDISSLTAKLATPEVIQKPIEEKKILKKIEEIKESPKEEIKQVVKETITPEPIKRQVAPKTEKKQAFNFEQYLGVKLAGIIGIIALVIGLAMVVKYAIDNDWVNPLTRVVFGFISGGILLSFAFFLKKKYQLFSAVILGGAVSTMFFTAFAGHAFYDLYPKGFAFSLMFIITAFTVFAAHTYNYEVIAVIGLVGAYAIPPLLSDGTGEIAYMFTYMAIINIGILVLCLLKNWKWVRYFAYGLTWIIAASWVLDKYKVNDLNMAMSFISVFYFTFYATFIGYKLLRKITFEVMDIITLLSNSFIYFGLGYYILNNSFTEMYLGLFCVYNALIHAAVAYMTYKRKVADLNIMYFVLALVMTFVTIAIPVQLEGAVVTLSWFTEMLVLYYIGNRFSVTFYKYIAYTVSVLGFFSLWHDWTSNYVDFLGSGSEKLTAFANKVFMTASLSSVALGVLWYLFEKRYNSGLAEEKPDVMRPAMRIAIPIIFYITIYFTFSFEIAHYFSNWASATKIQSNSSDYYYPIEDSSISLFMAEWLLIFSLVFMCVNLVISNLWLKSKTLTWIFYGLSIFVLLVYIPTGLEKLGDLRFLFNSESDSTFPSQFRSAWMINFRYVFMLFGFTSMVIIYLMQKRMNNKIANNVYIWIFHLGILTLLSSELVHQFRLSHPDDAIMYDKIARRIGFTILWALYSLTLIIVGIARRIKMLRIMGFSLFGVTIIKLLIDSASMSQGYKIIVWISVGIVLVLTGFLYQKFKNVLFEEDEIQN